MDTNEQIAIRIRAGDRTEIAHLWERLERFFRQQSGRFYRRHETACRYAGIEPDDLLQSCFIALYRAVQDYNPESGYKLTTYIHRHLQTAFAECCGYRTSKRDPLSRCDSLDAPISEGDETTKGERIPDLASEEEYHRIEEQSLQEAMRRDLRQCLDLLPVQNKKAIEARYWGNKTYREIGEALGITPARSRILEANGLRALRLRNARLSVYAWRSTGLNAWRNCRSSSVERAAEKADQVLRLHTETQ